MNYIQILKNRILELHSLSRICTEADSSAPMLDQFRNDEATIFVEVKFRNLGLAMQYSSIRMYCTPDLYLSDTLHVEWIGKPSWGTKENSYKKIDWYTIPMPWSGSASNDVEDWRDLANEAINQFIVNNAICIVPHTQTGVMA